MNQFSNNQAVTPLFVNPIVRKLNQINESDGTCATYEGIFKKTLYFLFTVLVGGSIAMLIHVIPFQGITDDDGVFVSYLELGSLLLSLAFVLVFTLLAFFAKKTTRVTGTLSCMGCGCVLATISAFVPDLRGPMLLAAILTFALVSVLLFLYFSKKVYLSNHFKVVVSTLFGTTVLGSLLLGICYFIPAFHETAEFIQSNPLLSLLMSLGGIIIACLFLLVDFDTIRNVVDKKLPEKYEWMAAYSLAFTVIWLYLKILDMFMTAQKNQRQ